MVRALVVVCLSLAVAGAAAAATGTIHATLTRPLPASSSGGDRVVVAWKLRDASGHPVSIRRVFLKITCPTRTDYTVAAATARPDGTYRVTAVVPPGGIGTLAVGTSRTAFPIAIPFRRTG